MNTLKYEEVYRTEYRDIRDARRQIGQFIESVYNRKRYSWRVALQGGSLVAEPTSASPTG